MENSESPATSADPAALREEMRELEVKVEARFQQFAKHVESLFDRMGPQIVATVYRLGDAAPMRITGPSARQPVVKERLSALEARLLE